MNTVEATRLSRVRTQLMTTLMMLSIIPLATMAAPKHMAQMMSHIVFSIPAMPPVETKSLSASEPVCTAVEPKNVIASPRVSAADVLSEESAAI